MDFTAVYTFGESRDNGSRDSFTTFPTFVNAAANPAVTGIQGTGSDFVPRDKHADWGLSEFDVRHNLTFTHVVELPFGRGGGRLSTIIRNWSLAGFAVLRSGEPINVLRGIDFNDDGDSSADRPALVSGSIEELYARDSLNRTQYLLRQADALRRLGTPPTVDPAAMIRRNALRAASIMFYDLSLIKKLALSERYQAGFEKRTSS